jgi:hypothetical protein
MRKGEAEKIARSGMIRWGELQETLKRAFESGAANEHRAIVNKSFDKATSYNFMCGYAKKYSPSRIVDNKRYGEWVGARHILVEFGRFWEGWRPECKQKPESPLHHQVAMEPPF